MDVMKWASKNRILRAKLSHKIHVMSFFFFLVLFNLHFQFAFSHQFPINFSFHCSSSFRRKNFSKPSNKYPVFSKTSFFPSSPPPLPFSHPLNHAPFHFPPPSSPTPSTPSSTPAHTNPPSRIPIHAPSRATRSAQCALGRYGEFAQDDGRAGW